MKGKKKEQKEGRNYQGKKEEYEESREFVLKWKRQSVQY